MTDQSTEFRAQVIKTRRLEIIATLEAELAELDLEIRVIGEAVVKAKAARREQLNSSLLTQLQGVLTERGLTDAIEEAQRRVDALQIQVQHLPSDDTEGGEA